MRRLCSMLILALALASCDGSPNSEAPPLFPAPTPPCEPAKTSTSRLDLRAVFRDFKEKYCSLSLMPDSRIVVLAKDGKFKEKLNASRGLVQRLRYATGLKLDIVTVGPGRSHDIVLSDKPDPSFFEAAEKASLTVTGPSGGSVNKSLKNNVLEEGYQFQSGGQGVSIKYNSATGALRGIQTLTELILNDGKAIGEHRSLPYVAAIDYPEFKYRVIMLDVGRLFMPVDQLIGYMDKMSLYKINYLQIHLNDNAQTPDNVYHGYFRLHSDNRPELIPPDKQYYTKEDWSRMEAAAERYGMTIVPEFESPGHALAWIQANPDLPRVVHRNGDGSQYDDIDVTTRPDFVAEYIESVIQEFRPWFKAGLIHISGEEAQGDPGLTAKYVNLLYGRLSRRADGCSAKTFSGVWAWSFANPVYGENSQWPWSDVLDQHIIQENWHDWAIKNKNITWIDEFGSDYYFVPRVGGGYNRNGLDVARAYDRYKRQLNVYARNGVIGDGILFAQWNDISLRTGISVDFVNAGMARSFPIFGLIGWRGAIKDAEGKVIEAKDVGLEKKITASQEVSSFWVRDQKPKLTAQQAMDGLMAASRHRRIDVNGPAANDHLVDGAKDSDWMAWDTEDMTRALEGSVHYGPEHTMSEVKPGECPP